MMNAWLTTMAGSVLDHVAIREVTALDQRDSPSRGNKLADDDESAWGAFRGALEAVGAAESGCRDDGGLGRRLTELAASTPGSTADMLQDFVQVVGPPLILEVLRWSEVFMAHGKDVIGYGSLAYEDLV